MKFTIDWLKEHLDTKFNDQKIIDKLTNVGLEVESFENQKSDLDEFIVAKIISTEKHPNADRLKLCNVDIGQDKIVKVVCGALNAKSNLYTVYAPPGAVIPKTNTKLSISKIRGVTSYGMLCSESELKLSNESEGIIDLSLKKYSKKIGKKFFVNKSPKVVDISITPNRADCLGVKGIARDLAAAGAGKLKVKKTNKIKIVGSQNIKVKIINDKNQGCTTFGSCLIKGIKNTESPKWLKDKIISLGQKPISAVVDITNYIMFDLNRPLHAYDADKIDQGIVVRNSKKGETFEALDHKKYTLENNMCVISDKSGVLGLGGIIGGIRSGTEIKTQNILLESAYFKPKSIRSTSKLLNLDTDAKYRFERGIDPNSIEEGLIKAAELIQKICGGSISRLNITKNEKFNSAVIKFPIDLFQNITGFNVPDKEIYKILSDLGFSIKKNKKILNLIVPSWRSDISQPIDIVEEIVRIKGYDQIKTVIPEKIRTKQTLNNHQKLFHFLQRSVASKGYYETVTWSFTDSKINDLFKEKMNEVAIVNPISSDLNVLRSSIFSNLVFYLKKNLDRDIKDISLFEIGPIFSGNKPGQQETVVAAIKSGKVSRLNWIEKERIIDVFDAKRDVIQSLTEIGLDRKKFYINSKAPNYYHPGKAGAIFQDKNSNQAIAFFGEIHPNITQKLDIKTDALIIFEIFVDRILQYKNKLKDQKKKYEYSDFQKSERDFAFIIDKNFNAQKLVKIISEIDESLIKNVRIFDLYEGENIPEDKKSIALSVTIQSFEKSLNDQDLEKINNLIISTVESKSGAKIRS
tara:strand:+ start:1150 stop:3558 length:2409 start_codon:yes stop_codon:yes gene_type:complete